MEYYPKKNQHLPDKIPGASETIWLNLKKVCLID